MSGVVARRNDREEWRGPVTSARLQTRSLPTCDDCLTNVHEQGGRGPLQRARWRRTAHGSGYMTYLCERHKREWDSWTPGQLEITA